MTACEMYNFLVAGLKCNSGMTKQCFANLLRYLKTLTLVMFESVWASVCSDHFTLKKVLAISNNFSLNAYANLWHVLTVCGSIHSSYCTVHKLKQMNKWTCLHNTSLSSTEQYCGAKAKDYTTSGLWCSAALTAANRLKLKRNIFTA